MTKKEIKKILMSMRTPENDSIVTPLLGEIDMMDEKTIEKHLQKIGDTEELIRNFFKNIIIQRTAELNPKHYPINSMFTYGINSNVVHLHLPGDFHQMWNEIGPHRTIDTINLHLIDALDRVKEMRDDGFYRFKDKDSIYMISPVLIKKELSFLEDLYFQTSYFKRANLNDEEFLKNNSEAQLAVKIFGKNHSIGTASLKFSVMETENWKEKKNKKVEELKGKGIVLQSKNSKEK